MGINAMKSLRKVYYQLILVYYDIADAIIIVYDVTNIESFNDSDSWINSVKSVSQNDVELFLVGSKADKNNERTIAKRLAANYAHKKKIHFQEATSLNPESLNNLLQKITSYALKKRNKENNDVQKAIPNKECACLECMLI